MILLWLALAHFAHAIENLDCADHLGGRMITIAGTVKTPILPHQVLIRGHLLEHGWSIVDEDYGLGRLPSSSQTLHPLEDGDDIYLINEDGTVKAHLYFGVQLSTAPSEEDIPGLFWDRSRLKFYTAGGDTRKLFAANHRAVVIRRSLSPQEVAKLRTQLLPIYAAAKEFERKGGRQLRFADGQSFNLRHYDKVYRGRMKRQRSTKPRHVQYAVEVDGQLVPSLPGDTLIFLTPNNSLLGIIVPDRVAIPAEAYQYFDQYTAELIIIK